MQTFIKICFFVCLVGMVGTAGYYHSYLERHLETCRENLSECRNVNPCPMAECPFNCLECPECPECPEDIVEAQTQINHYRDCARRAREYGLAVYECGTDEERFGTEREYACTNVDRLEARCPIFRGGT